MGQKISAIVLVGGEIDQNLYEKCLGSISWVDEIIKIKTDNLKGSFADWRNYGAKKAKGDWILYVDTDEEVTPALRQEIVSSIEYPVSSISAFAIPRNNILLGKKMRYGGWWPDYVLRLIKKGALVSWEGKIHEQPKIKESASRRIGKLKNPLIHISHRSLSEMVDKTNAWSEIEARLLFESGHPRMNIFRFFTAGFREFWYRGIKKLGFLDGTIGIIEVMYQTYSRLITYAKLWERQINENRNL